MNLLKCTITLHTQIANGIISPTLQANYDKGNSFICIAGYRRNTYMTHKNKHVHRHSCNACHGGRELKGKRGKEGKKTLRIPTEKP